MGSTPTQRRKRQKLKGELLQASVAVSVATDSYEQQLATKRTKVEELFKDYHIPNIEVFESPKEHYRLRAEFRVWQSADDIYYIMFEKVDQANKRHEKQSWEKRRMDTFPVASELINELMEILINHIREERPLRQKLFQANFLATLSGEAMVTMVYHRQLDGAWEAAAKKLQDALSKAPSLKVHPVNLIGRSKNQKMVLNKDFVLERMRVGDDEFEYKQIEGGFSQPNGEMCRNMLRWARGVTKGSNDGDLLELYCGNGNFTIALAANFREVIATEVTKASVAAAKYNVEANGIGNVHIARLSSEEFTKAWRGERDFFRMKDMPDVKNRKFKTLLVDPPRAGLDDKTVDLLQNFDNIVYISCNPITLHKNLQHILASHRVKQFALFDQFPYTDHIECGVYLERTA